MAHHVSQSQKKRWGKDGGTDVVEGGVQTSRHGNGGLLLPSQSGEAGVARNWVTDQHHPCNRQTLARGRPEHCKEQLTSLGKRLPQEGGHMAAKEGRKE